MKIFLLLIFLKTNVLLFAQVDFHWQNPKPTGQHLTSIFFTSNDTGFVCGAYGEILKTTNAGNAWTHANIPQKNYLFSIQFSKTNHSLGICAGTNGLILRTTDAGSSWQTLSRITSETLLKVTFAENGSIFICGTGGVIMRSTDNGQNFTILSSGIADVITSINFPNAQTGYAVAQGTLIYTSNAGETWSKKKLNYPSDLYSVLFINEKIGWISGAGSLLLRTTDGGATFTQIKTETFDELVDIQFADADTGYILGSQVLIKTIDGGKNWSRVYHFSFGSSSKSLCQLDNKTIMVCGVDGIIEKSIDAGITFAYVSRNNTYKDFTEVRCLNKNSSFLWAAGQTFAFSTDEGETWNFHPNPLTSSFLSVAYLTEQRAIAITRTGKIFLTDDNFFSTREVSNPSAVWLKKVLVTHNGTAFCVGDRGVILRSADNGNSWNIVKNGTEDLYDIKFLDDFIGYAVGHGIVLRSLDNGVNWQRVSNIDTKFIFSVDFYDKSLGVIGTDSDSIYITKDAGNTWIVSQTKAGGDFRCVRFLDKNTIVGVGSFGTIIISKDLGVTWQTIEARQYFDWYSVCVTSKSIVIAGTAGRIKKSNYSTSNMIASCEKGELPNSYSMSQNFPNPFNPTTEIQYKLPEKGHVSITIYDMLGREVKRIVGEIQQAGNHTIEFDASDLASGIYLYSLRANDYQEIKKMCLIK